MDKRHIQSFLMVSAAFFALNASARPNDTRVVTSANATHAVTRVTSTARINERSDSIEK
ncbi:hypothetical protein [Burkholderia sp. L27(2015)]|uniref:hypothetical protein n=1 Tax=Burkholderia sp. L27(2015) TaxID=1641858 RepID=UPI0015771157|nr:hypothetical protein [Burkholderia sp. L27(2015)]